MIVESSARVTDRLREACAMFGLGVRRARARRGERSDESGFARDLLDALAPGEIALIVGPSGCGKTTALRALARRVRLAGGSCLRADAPPLDPGRSLVDLVRGSIHDALVVLAAAGLSDATLLARRSVELSEGERFRLRLALAMSRATRACAPTILADEFATSLDRATALGVSSSLRRWVWRERARVGDRAPRVVVATVHEDVAPALRPDVVCTPSDRGASVGGRFEFVRVRGEGSA